MSELYIISPEKFELEVFLPKLDLALQEHRPTLFQLRLKNTSQETILRAAEEIIPICHNHGVKFTLNDSAELAKQCGADGVHLGEESEEYEKARAILGESAHIGISCYADVPRALEFAKKGANLVSFGQFHPTKTKPPKGWATPQTITDFISRNENKKCKTAAIGGLNFENLQPVEETGVDYICMVSAIWDNI